LGIFGPEYQKIYCYYNLPFIFVENKASPIMENHHHEEPKPTNKWLATPILMAVIVIAGIVTFLGQVSGQCCDGECKAKNKTEHSTEQHGTTHENDHGTGNTEHATTDSTHATTDSTAAHDGHESHGEGH
jgi:hypothetical protein